MLERRAAGVEVRIIFDDIGSIGTDTDYFKRLREAGIEIFRFHPVNPVEDIRLWRINQRNHRKLLVVDGKVAFTGGMNFHSVYTRSSFSPPSGESDLRDRWRDTQISIEGPAVAEF